MIYITGFNFIFNVRTRPSTTSGSIQEQIVMARRNLNQPKTSSVFDPRFIPGHTYKIARIKKIVENEENKICYLFADMTDHELPDIDILVSDTAAGDNYVAAISGETQQLKEEREKINATLEIDNSI